MPRDRINGAPVQGGQGWVVLRRLNGGKAWDALEFTFRRTRREAIRRYDALWTEPGEYARRRRAGEVIAVHCTLEPICLPEFAGDADRREVVDVRPPGTVLHVSDSGDRKISVIKAIRQWARLGLTQAKLCSEGRWDHEISDPVTRRELSAELDELGATFEWRAR